MSTRNCTCKARDLLWKGCTCRYLQTRTIAINFLIPELGMKKSWEIIDKHLWKCPNIKLKLPTDCQDVLRAMWEIERNSIDLYEAIAKDMEEAFRYPKGKHSDSPATLNLNKRDEWSF